MSKQQLDKENHRIINNPVRHSSTDQAPPPPSSRKTHVVRLLPLYLSGMKGIRSISSSRRRRMGRSLLRRRVRLARREVRGRSIKQRRVFIVDEVIWYVITSAHAHGVSNEVSNTYALKMACIKPQAQTPELKRRVMNQKILANARTHQRIA